MEFNYGCNQLKASLEHSSSSSSELDALTHSTFWSTSVMICLGMYPALVALPRMLNVMFSSPKSFSKSYFINTREFPEMDSI